MNTKYDIIIVGGGAAGFFTAINTAENISGARIAILERGSEVLTKVKISGGGRCNVTHAEFVPKELSQNYPRGEKELLGPFHSFMTGDTMAWFEDRGVALKIEEDGRIFPVSDQSQTIIDCFLSETNRLDIDVIKNCSVKHIEKQGTNFQVSTTTEEFICEKLVIASGSNPKIWKLLEHLGHTVIPPVPSLFTFNITDHRIKDLPGISTEVTVEVISQEGVSLLYSNGPLLITHWGMSGPAILKLSAWGARILETLNYHFTIKINWLVYREGLNVLNELKELKSVMGKKRVVKNPQFDLPKRLWQSLVEASGIQESQTFAEVNKTALENLALQLTASYFEVHGKSTFKEEFVTAGGVELKEVNFKTFESKICSHLYFAGEVLNVDAITGGFNFQNAWTGGYLVAMAMK